MAVLTFRFRWVMALLIAAGTLASARAATSTPQPLRVVPARSQVGSCDVDDAKPPRPHPFEASPLPVQAERPLVLDAVMYLATTQRLGTAGAHGARCSSDPYNWELGVIDRRVEPPRYY